MPISLITITISRVNEVITAKKSHLKVKKGPINQKNTHLEEKHKQRINLCANINKNRKHIFTFLNYGQTNQ